ncbi:pyridoxal phosphate-dependent aminotransferase [Methanogenium sp. MK-MG]|uniref:pyridoxal phosphate-dependent aminotransferase n=1 Tax=Methanogenium sp. MK-MG TaxID=2599926 RepID=UPI0013EA33BD|nr:pyridoxal phosphate-dependent aminotransferase [Methanogenium sp. MK-MG]KAF1078551.1 Aromatic-amino-acid aminotransferase 2 [Methanogenium sp. MK-MG]
MRSLSRKVTEIAPSATIEISDRAAQMRAAGIDVIGLSIGEPDFPTPAHITRACIDALERGETHYAPSPGIPALREAIAEKLQRENDIPCTPGQVIVACGAKDSIYEAMEAVINPGDEVLIIDPSWVSYEPCVQLAGGVPVHCGVRETDFQVDDSLLEVITPKTKMIICNSPSNPSGAVMNAASLRLIADAATDNDCYVLSDEIYEKLIYGKTHVSIGSFDGMADRTITVNGFSKAYAMTGWRIGYAAAPEPVAKQMIKVQQHTISHPATFAMHGAVAALTGDQQCVEAMRCEFDTRRQYITAALHEMGYETAPAEGAFYAYVKAGPDDMAVSARWLAEAHVAVTPGTAFGTPGWVRLSYAASLDRLKEAMRRIAALSD